MEILGYNMPEDLYYDEHHFWFRKEGDEWFYVEGNVYAKQPVRRETPKIGRNDPCPCGSGKKYKKCCCKGRVRQMARHSVQPC